MSLDTRTADHRSTDTVAQVTDRVLAKHPELGADSVRARVVQAHGQYAESRIQDFVPVLVEREVLDDLRRDGTTG